MPQVVVSRVRLHGGLLAVRSEARADVRVHVGVVQVWVLRIAPEATPALPRITREAVPEGRRHHVPVRVLVVAASRVARSPRADMRIRALPAMKLIHCPFGEMRGQ